jgi:hypothetical protein
LKFWFRLFLDMLNLLVTGAAFERPKTIRQNVSKAENVKAENVKGARFKKRKIRKAENSKRPKFKRRNYNQTHMTTNLKKTILIWSGFLRQINSYIFTKSILIHLLIIDNLSNNV